MLVGIDLGTTNSLVACFKDGNAKLIPNRLGSFLTPSVVGVDENGILLIGETAKEYGVLHPLNTAKVFKRSMGTEQKFALGEMQMTAVDLSALILRSLKEDAEHYLECPVNDAIISVPAYFNEFQRKATKEAGELAGLNVVRIINEPTAAAIAYGMGIEDKDERCLVFDLGGGTFDVSILEYYKNIMEVHAISGNNFLGGEDFTKVLANLFLKKAAIAPESLDIRTMNRVLKAAEVCKCKFLSEKEPVMSCIVEDDLIEFAITPKEYEEECAILLDQLRKPIERSLRDANVRLDEIDRVVLVGGATRLPIIRSFVAKIFNRFPYFTDPDTAVAIGAALQCGMKSRDKEIKEIVLTDVCPFTLGTCVSMDNGYFEEGNHFLPIIDRNTVIPVSRTKTVCTAHDNQTRVNVEILQGESRIASNNLQLAEVSIPVPAGPKGKESLDITYTYDINSLLEVIVKVNSTGVTRKIIVQSSSDKLSEEETTARFERLAYLKQNPRNEEVNKLLIFRAERLYEEITGSVRDSINYAIMDFERALDSQDRTKIGHARKELTSMLDKIESEL